MTAPMRKFRCLFTHDVRQKKKRWQDGYLKFHTFNNRVMVSDQARNHIGDTYWKESHELQEGEELSLDKGVLVEVAEAVGVTQTDLAPLFERKTKDAGKEPPARPTASAPIRPFQRPSSVAPVVATRTSTQLRHKSLNTLFGTPKGPVGKAQPMRSPYEERKEKEKENELAEERAPKRQKTAQRPGGWRASSPVQEEESPAKATPLWAKTADAKSNRAAQMRMPPVTKVITISSESDHIPVFTSDVTLPSTPAKVVIVRPNPRPPVTSAPMISSSVLHEPLPVETPVETPRPPPAKKMRLPKPKPVETPKRPAPNSSPPVSVENRLTNVNFAVQPMQEYPKAPSSKPSPPRNPQAKSLRLSTGVKRGTLLCQSMPKPAPRAGSEPRASGVRPHIAKTSRTTSKEPSPALSVSDRTDGRADSRVSPPLKRNRKTQDVEGRGDKRSPKATTPVVDMSEDVFDDPEIIHGLMDQQLLVPLSPFEVRQDPIPPPRKAPLSKSTVTKSTTIKPSEAQKHAEAEPPSDEEPVAPKLPTTNATTKKAQPKKKAQEKEAPKKKTPAKKPPEKLPPVRTISPPPESIFEPSAPASRDPSPTHTEASGPPSRTSSKSPSKPLLSTGGFRKKPTKRSAKEAATATAIVTVIPKSNVTIPIPPGPTTSKPDLASAPKPKKRTRKDKSDPIEDDTPAPTTTKSPARKIRRVRSENDAPIPSTADDWVKRSLPKLNTSSSVADPELATEPKKRFSSLAALVKRTDPRKKFVRSVSTGGLGGGMGIGGLNGGEDGMGGMEDLPSPVLVVDGDVGPWSTEAGDLFDWKPPVREDGDT